MRDLIPRWDRYSLGCVYFGGKGSGGGQTSTTSQTSETKLPSWVDSAAQNNWTDANNVSQNLMTPYTGQRVADQTSGQLADIASLQNNVGSTNPAFALAQDTAAQGTGYQPSQVTAGQLSNTNLSAYMNPYTQSVINNGLSALDTQRQQSLNQVGQQAITAGAFGGSRQGVQEGVTNAGSALAAGNLASQLMAQNYTQAQGAAQQDITGNLQAQIANQNAGLSGAQLNQTAATNLGNLAAQGQQSFLAGNSAALAGQDAIQAQQQNQLGAQQQAYQEQQQFPVQQLNILLSALGQTPYGSTTNTTGTSTQPTSGSGLLQGLGGASAGLGILGQLGGLFGGGGAAAAGGLGGMSSLGGAGLLALGGSDRKLKTDVKRIGEDEETGLPIYAYRYKGDPKTYPKVVGPMAQDIAKKFPDQVKEVGGKLAVNLGFGPMQDAFHG